jgi:hypothetical protein
MFDSKPAARIGRPKGSLNKRTIFAREWAEKLGLQDPAEFLIRVMNSDTIEVTKADVDGNAVLDSEGKPVKQLAVVPLDTRILAARELLGYVYPRLSAQQIESTVDTTVTPALPTEAILRDARLCEAMSELALLVATEGADYDSRPLLPGPNADRVIGD